MRRATDTLRRVIKGGRYSHSRVKVVDVFDDDFSQQILLVHDGRVTATYKFCLHLIHFVKRSNVGRSSPRLGLERSRFVSYVSWETNFKLRV